MSGKILQGYEATCLITHLDGGKKVTMMKVVVITKVIM
jgi:hypothetical protein